MSEHKINNNSILQKLINDVTDLIPDKIDKVEEAEFYLNKKTGVKIPIKELAGKNLDGFEYFKQLEIPESISKVDYDKLIERLTGNPIGYEPVPTPVLDSEGKQIKENGKVKKTDKLDSDGKVVLKKIYIDMEKYEILLYVLNAIKKNINPPYVTKVRDKTKLKLEVHTAK